MRSPRALVVGLSAVGMLVFQLAWLLTIPPFHGIDEIDHVYRGSMIAQGHWVPEGAPLDRRTGRGDPVRVRADIVAAAHAPCLEFDYYAPANCSPYAQTSNPDEVIVASASARYNPVFYAVVETVAAHFRGYGNLYAMRATAAVLCTAMFAAGLWSLLTFARTRWLPASLLVATTPVTLYSTTVAAPNGLELMSGLTLWCALFALFVAEPPPAPGVRRGLLIVAALSGVTLVTVHTLGPMWLALIVLVVLILARPPEVWRRIRGNLRGHLITALVVGAATLASVAWVFASGTNDPSDEGTISAGSPFPDVLLGLPLWPLQAIATYPSRAEAAPLQVYGMALVMMTLLLLLALRGLRGRLLLGVLTIVVISYLVPIALTVATYHQIGLAWQGRYGLPLAAGFFLVLGLALDRRTPGHPLGTVVVWLAAGTIGLEMLLSQRHIISHELRLPLWQDNPHWHVPSTLLLTVLAATGVACWALALVAVPQSDNRRHA